LRTALARDVSSGTDEWLRCLYSTYHARFLADNDKIWGNGRVMISFSLSAFGIYAAYRPTFFGTCVLALASVSLLLVWLVNAETHRAFQNKSLAWLLAIERVVFGDELAVPVKISDDTLNTFLSGKRGAQ
jgi:hypothetical protein